MPELEVVDHSLMINEMIFVLNEVNTALFSELDSGKVVTVTEEEATEITNDGNYIVWTEPGDDLIYAGTVETWTNKFLDESIDEKAKYTDEDFAEALKLILAAREGSVKSPITKNNKTGSTIDFTSHCRYTKKGHSCPYCYVMLGRKKAKGFVRNLFDKGWNLDDIKKLVSTGKYQKKGASAKATKGSSLRSGQFKRVYDNVPYDGQLLKLKTDDIASENAKGGMRLYSNSDYGSTNKGMRWEDKQLAALFNDADKIGLKLKAITKNKKFINKWSDRTSVTDFSIDELGKHGAPTNSVTFEEAKKIVAGHDKVKIRIVAFNPEEAIEYANDKDISVVTLFHGKVGALPKEVTDKVNVIDMTHNTAAYKKVKEEVGPKLWRQKFCASSDTHNCTNCPVACGATMKEQIMYGEIVESVKKKLNEEDDQNLIAAASDLLAACKMAAGVLVDYIQSVDDDSLERDAFEQLQQAIAKAEGE